MMTESATLFASNLVDLAVQANSAYNDGYTREFYKQEYERLLKQKNMEKFSEEIDDYILPPHTD